MSREPMIRVYWKNATDRAAGPEHGVSPGELTGVATQVIAAHAGLMDKVRRVERRCAERRQGKDVPKDKLDKYLAWVLLPEDVEHPRNVRALVDKHRPHTTDMVVLGIGGSALGNIALQAALNPPTYNLLPERDRPGAGPRLFVLDNVDPALVGCTLDLLGPRLATTLVNVISKSGETPETAAQLMVLRELLRQKLGTGFAARVVATTDPNSGALKDIARQDGYEVLPAEIGGRFSVLSPVGLFSAAMCGINIEALLAGAAGMKRRVEAAVGPGNWHKNPACILAAIKYLAFTTKGKPMHVMMPYSNRLYLLADWYRQLWAESLGKRRTRAGKEVLVGPTPIKALGATDQHSQVQLYREGPNDKLIVFLEVAEHGRDLAIPDVFADVPGVSYLRGGTLGGLLNAEKVATEFALAFSKRPSITIRFEAVTPESVGQFIYLYEFTAGLMGELLDIDAYDQPAVELGKDATFALMGRTGPVRAEVALDLGRPGVTYGELRKDILAFASTDEAYLA